MWRAKDPRLGREVAIKVLPASFSADADRLRRFEQEARAAGILNHPNITAVYDIGSHEGAPYVVQELLEGETLRSLLAGGRLAPRKTIDYSLQIAHGLAAAHEKGIVHRDLKPENLFVTRDGRVKILDFGLAKLTHTEARPDFTSLPTATAGTEPGVVLGTLGYMSPEQVRGRQADARSDIFSFGAILYEMLSGKRAFHGDSAADTMSAILKEDPPELSVTNQSISPGLERIVRHCIEKNPEQRFHSAHDLAFDLEALSGTSGQAAAAPALVAGRNRKRAAVFLPALIALAFVAAAFWAGRSSRGRAQPAPAVPIYSRLTFRRGNVLYARFAPDGQTVVYGAAWGDKPAEIFLARAGSPESRPLDLPNASLLSISSSGELAILLKKANLFGTVGSGTLARVPLTGGAPREVLEDVYQADWSPDGVNLAVLASRGGKTVLEFPIGKRIYESGAELTSLRVSPDGLQVAVVENDGTGSAILLFGGKGGVRKLVSGWNFIDSIAWHPSGIELWFDGLRPVPGVGTYAATLDGKVRVVQVTGSLDVLHDIARDGRVLIEREISTREVFFGKTGDPRERNLSWLDQSSVASLSPDGENLLFSEQGEGGGEKGSVYFRKTDGSPPARLGDGRALDLSADGKWALALVPSGSSSRLYLLPTGAGEPRPVPLGNLNAFGGTFVPPDGKRIAIVASEPGHAARGYVLDLMNGKTRPFTPEGLTGGAAFSPDGTLLATNGPDGRAMLFPLAGGDPRPLPGLEPKETPLQWSADGKSLYTARFGELPLKIERLDLATQKKQLWKQILPEDRAGLIRIESVFVTPDGRHWAYSFNRVLVSDLYLVTGLR